MSKFKASLVRMWKRTKREQERKREGISTRRFSTAVLLTRKDEKKMNGSDTTAESEQRSDLLESPSELKLEESGSWKEEDEKEGQRSEGNERRTRDPANKKRKKKKKLTGRRKDTIPS